MRIDVHVAEEFLVFSPEVQLTRNKKAQARSHHDGITRELQYVTHDREKGDFIKGAADASTCITRNFFFFSLPSHSRCSNLACAPFVVSFSLCF